MQICYGPDPATRGSRVTGPSPFFRGSRVPWGCPPGEIAYTSCLPLTPCNDGISGFPSFYYILHLITLSTICSEALSRTLLREVIGSGVGNPRCEPGRGGRIGGAQIPGPQLAPRPIHINVSCFYTFSPGSLMIDWQGRVPVTFVTSSIK